MIVFTIVPEYKPAIIKERLTSPDTTSMDTGASSIATEACDSPCPFDMGSKKLISKILKNSTAQSRLEITRAAAKW